MIYIRKLAITNLMTKGVFVTFENEERGLYFLPARVLAKRPTNRDRVCIQRMWPIDRPYLTKDDIFRASRGHEEITCVLVEGIKEVRKSDVSPEFDRFLYTDREDTTKAIFKCIGLYCGDNKVAPLSMLGDKLAGMIKKKQYITFDIYEDEEDKLFVVNIE